MKKLTIIAAFAAAVLLCAACGAENESTSASDIPEEISEETVQSADIVSKEPEKKLLSSVYKVPGEDIYTDAPDYNRVDHGYSMLFYDRGIKYTAFVCLDDREAQSLEDCYDECLKVMIKHNDSQHHIVDADKLETKETTVNGIDALAFEGTVKTGYGEPYDAYMYGYTFIFNGKPCMAAGAVTDSEQPESEKAELCAIVDAMANSIRSEK